MYHSALSVHLTICLLAYQFVRPSIHPSVPCPSILLFVILSILTKAISSIDPKVALDILLLPLPADESVPSPDAGVRGLDDESLLLSLVGPLP